MTVALEARYQKFKCAKCDYEWVSQAKEPRCPKCRTRKVNPASAYASSLLGIIIDVTKLAFKEDLEPMKKAIEAIRLRGDYNLRHCANIDENGFCSLAWDKEPEPFTYIRDGDHYHLKPTIELCALCKYFEDKKEKKQKEIINFILTYG